jgi:serine-type D-Ala-D-Ala endopeptidase (penicillin-binding protein 7)
MRFMLQGSIVLLGVCCAMAAQGASHYRDEAVPRLGSAAAMVFDQDAGRVLFEKNTDTVLPIASITKLMTAMVILDSGLALGQDITIAQIDTQNVKTSRSKIQPGMSFPRLDLLKLALMASENRAAAALARSFPGGTPGFVAEMNIKAAQLGMLSTRFMDPTGLNPGNVSTASDLVKMVNASYSYPIIRDFSTSDSMQMELNSPRKRKVLAWHNSNRLVINKDWDIGLSKTGYISEAGRCLVMQARIAERKVIIVLLDSWGKFTRVADAARIKRWIEALERRQQTTVVSS